MDKLNPPPPIGYIEMPVWRCPNCGDIWARTHCEGNDPNYPDKGYPDCCVTDHANDPLPYEDDVYVRLPCNIDASGLVHSCTMGGD